MRLLYYPDYHAHQAERNVGISAHTDFECITFIYQSSPGLELTDVHGQWYDCPAHDGRMVVLIDDMLERWTNGHLKATGHRVRNTSEKRFSVVMFFAVNDNVQIAPLSQFTSAKKPARYASTTQLTHLNGEIDAAKDNANGEPR